MSASRTITDMFRHPYVLAVCCAFIVSLIYWQVRTDWPETKGLAQGRALFANTRSAVIAWKQPMVPAQFAQASCGACHREDLPQTPRLNHGRQLIARFNCVGCHQLQNIDRPAMLGPDLSSVGTKVSREWIYKWLKDPRTVTNADSSVKVDGVEMDPRMPKFQLSDLELRALSAYLSVQRARKLAPSRISVAIAKTGVAAEQGHTRFNQMFCVTCHAIAVDRGGETKLIGGDIGPELTKVGSKVKPEWLVAWLRDPQGYLEHTRMPRYQWSDKALYEVTQYILTKLTDPDLLKDVPGLQSPTESEVQLGRTLFVEKGCAECHVIQGVKPRPEFAPDLSALGMAAGPYPVQIKSPRKLSVAFHFVKRDVEELDIVESIVPRSMVAYLQTKITDPASITPETYMPQFHFVQSDLDDLTTALLSMSGLPLSNSSQDRTIIERRHLEFRPDGEAGQLYQRYKCYVCHRFNGYGGTLAPDLSYEGSRSKREWLIQFLRNPQTLRPTLTFRMPAFNMSEQDATTLADFLLANLRKPDLNTAATNQNAFTPQMADLGKQLFEEKYRCQSCHTIGSNGGYVGPSLNNIGNWMTPGWVEAWLRNPQALVPDTIEPRHSLNDDEVKNITAYLMTLKQTSVADTTASNSAGTGQP
jgi:cbb3-type cytochrome oxidase cytochrome c subunit